jgi:hypothetical protein
MIKGRGAYRYVTSPFGKICKKRMLGSAGIN